MKNDSIEKHRRFRVTWLLLAALLVFACTFSTDLNGTTPPSPTQTPYPTYTPYPTNAPAEATQEIATELPATEPPATEPPAQPLPTLAAKPTSTPKPAAKPPKPTATLYVQITGILPIKIIKSDIQVLKVYPTSTTSTGTVNIDIKNNGPAEYNGTVQVRCQGIFFNRGLPNQQLPVVYAKDINIDIGLGTGFIPLDLSVDPVSYSYPMVQCVLGIPNNEDPNPNNNSGVFTIP